MDAIEEQQSTEAEKLKRLASGLISPQKHEGSTQMEQKILTILPGRPTAPGSPASPSSPLETQKWHVGNWTELKLCIKYKNKVLNQAKNKQTNKKQINN